jgi:hypothetical protein
MHAPEAWLILNHQHAPSRSARRRHGEAGPGLRPVLGSDGATEHRHEAVGQREGTATALAHPPPWRMEQRCKAECAGASTTIGLRCSMGLRPLGWLVAPP